MTNQELEKINDPKDYSWIKVKQFNLASYPDSDHALDGLEEHHKKETEFLINVCRELAQEVAYLREAHYGMKDEDN